MAIAANQKIISHHEKIQITWMINSANRRLAAALEEAGLDYRTLDLRPSFSLIRNPFAALGKILKIKRALRQLHPGLVVIVQGSILDAFDGVLAARLARLRYCSYIPMAHSPIEYSEHRFVHMRSAVVSLFFRFVPFFITIDEQQADRLRRWNRKAQIAVVENFIPRPAMSVRKTAEVRKSLGIPVDATVLGVVGRIDFRQKAQDWLVNVQKEGSLLEGKVLVFIGDGPDSPRLTQLIESSPWREHIYQLGWRDGLDGVYDAIDLLIIPSRTEGVPLVMLEALARRVPVVGSDRDGMKSWLPSQWRFPFGDSAAMKHSINWALGRSDAGYWDAIEKHLANATDEERFACQFANTLIKFGSRSPETQ